MKFKPHGKASCTLDGQLILLDLEGPWNAELMLQIQHDVDGLKASLATNKNGVCSLLYPTAFFAHSILLRL